MRVRGAGVAAVVTGVVALSGLTAPAPAMATETVLVDATLSRIHVDPAHPAAGDPGVESSAHESGGGHDASTGSSDIDAIAIVAGRVVDIPDAAAGTVADGAVVLTVEAPPSADQPHEVATALAAGDASVVEVEPDTGASSPAPAPDDVSATAVSHTITVLPVHFGSPGPETQESLQRVADAAGAFFETQTRGGIDVTSVTVRPWAQIPAATGCAYDQYFNAALTANGMAPPAGATEHVVVYWPRLAECSWAGLGQLGGPRMWINGYMHQMVWTHELGHNVGLGHASAAACTDAEVRVPLSGTCTYREYGDRSDVMGSGWNVPPLTAGMADVLGLLGDGLPMTPGAPVRIPASGGEGGAPDGRSVVKLRSGDATLYFEYRPTAGLGYSTGWEGVQVRRRLDRSRWTDVLDLGAHHGRHAPDPFTRPVLEPGTVWTIPGTDLTVAVLDLAPAEATVVFTDRRSDTGSPPAPASVRGATPDGWVGPQSRISWAPVSAEDHAGYVAYVDGERFGTAGPDADSLPLPFAIAEGAHRVAVAAVDRAGNLSPLTEESVTVDATAPTAPGVGEPYRQPVSTSSILTWTPSADTGSGIARYEVVTYPAGKRQKIGEAGAAATSATVVIPPEIADGYLNIGVVAYDRVGNSTAAYTWLAVDRTVPTAVAFDTPRMFAGELSLGWSVPNDPSGIARYDVTLDGKAVTPTSYPHWSSESLRVGSRHTVEVRPVDRAGNVGPAASTTFTVPGPAAPDVSGTPRTQGPSATVTWTPGSGGTDVEDWRIYVDGRSYAVPVDAADRSAGLGWLEHGAHEVVVAAVDSTWTETRSAPIVIHVDATGPTGVALTSPTNGTASRSADLELRWGAARDPESGVNRYDVFVDGALVTTAAGDARSAMLTLDTGTHRILLRAVNGVGVATDSEEVTVTIDTTRPSLDVPSVRLARGAAAGYVPIRVTASAYDGETAVCRMAAMLGSSTLASAGGGDISATVRVPSGAQTLTIPATDCAGNRTTRSVAVSTTVVPETGAPAATGWSTESDARHWGGAARTTKRAGAKATFTVTGSQLAWVAHRSAATGVADVYVDGSRVAVVDTRGVGHQRVVWWHETWYGKHTVEIRARGTAGRPAVYVDALIVRR